MASPQPPNHHLSCLAPFDRFAQPYNIGRVLSLDLSYNATAYAEYSPLYLTATFLRCTWRPLQY